MSEALWDKLAKAKTSKSRRIIKKKLPRFNEGAKKVLLLEGGKSSQTVRSSAALPPRPNPGVAGTARATARATPPGCAGRGCEGGRATRVARVLPPYTRVPLPCTA
jgi:hypothetical protein